MSHEHHVFASTLGAGLQDTSSCYATFWQVLATEHPPQDLTFKQDAISGVRSDIPGGPFTIWSRDISSDATDEQAAAKHEACVPVLCPEPRSAIFCPHESTYRHTFPGALEKD